MRKAGTDARAKLSLYHVLLLVAIFAFWYAMTAPGLVSEEFAKKTAFFFGRPLQVLNVIWVWFSGGKIYPHLWITLVETLLAFALGSLLGLVVGLWLALSPMASALSDPYIKAANSMPRVVLGSIFIIWFGLGLPSKVALAVVLVFFVVFFNAFQGVREVDRNLIANARILGASPRRVTSDVIIPSALSWIIASLHTSFGFALVGAVVGEYLGAIKGLGLMIATAQNTFNPNGVFGAMFILAAVALLAEAGVTALENRLIRWRPNVITDVTL